MKFEIYADVLFFINFSIDCLLIAAACLFIKKYISLPRLLLAASFGALAAVLAYILTDSAIINFILGIAIAPLMLGLGVKFKNFKALLRGALFLYITTFIFGGLLFYIYQYSPLSAFFVMGPYGIYFNMPYLLLLFMAVCCFFLACALMKIKEKKLKESGIATLVFGYRGSVVKARAFLDSGNNLKDPVTGLPVVICYIGAFKANREQVQSQLSHARRVAYRGVENNFKTLPVLPVENAGVQDTDICFDALFAVTNKKIDRDFDAIINPLAFKAS